MRFTSFLVAGIFALAANAQSSTSATAALTSASGTSSAAAPTDSAQAAVLNCLKACAAGDVTCQAKCVPVPAPDNAAANATTECVAKCPQGNGTATDNQNYAQCVDGCIAKYYFSTGAPQATSSSGSGSGSGSTITSVAPLVTTITTGGSTIVSTTGSSTITQVASSASSGSGSVSTSSSRAAGDAVYSPMGSSLGLVGFLAALLAL